MLGDVVHMDFFPRGSVTHFCSTRYQLHSSETWSDDPMVAVRKLPTVMVYKAPATRIREEHVSGLGDRPRAHLSWYAVAAMCPGTRRPRSCPRTCGNPGVSTTAGPPASSTRVQEQEWRRSELLGSRTVARVIGTRPVKACGGFNLGVMEGSLNSTILLYYGMNTCLTIPLDDPNAWARPL